MDIKIRKMNFEDIDLKIKWINDKKNNRFLHYDLPLEKKKTEEWYLKNRCSDQRFDGIIECDGIPVGLIGLLSIKDDSAEYYITMGEQVYKGKGIARKASDLIIQKAFFEYNLEKLYLYTETENVLAQKLFNKLNFQLVDIEVGKICNRGKPINRYYYELLKKDYIINSSFFNTPLYLLETDKNNIYIKRDDLIPFSFGGNKVRKATLFFKDFEKGDYDYIVTYGTSSSNHCRIIANLAASKNILCTIISPNEASKETANKSMMRIFNANIIFTEVAKVKETINSTLDSLRKKGFKPYFIQGGGHGNIGTQAYVDAYQEIYDYQKSRNIHFDYIFFATGTGTTQAGLVCGKILNKDMTNIVGISIARKVPYGRDIVINSIKDYFDEKNIKVDEKEIEKNVVFIDDYISQGYGKTNAEVKQTIKQVLIKYGVPLDTTYTGKAYYGMNEYINKHNIKNKNILFIHTGGIPLFFNDLEKL